MADSTTTHGASRTSGLPPAITRRSLLTGAATTALLTVAGTGAYAAPVRKPGAARGRSVAVFGAGISGLTAAHELVERGFEVDVYERWPILGGKTRGWSIPGTGTRGRLDLPREHGFRFFGGFYNNVTDSMQRIPRPETKDTCYDSLRFLADTQRGFNWHGLGLAASNGVGSSLVAGLPINTPGPIDPTFLADPAYLATTVGNAFGVLQGLELKLVPDMLFFLQRVLAYITSSEIRKQEQWDKISWWDYMEADRRSEYFRTIFIQTVTQLLQASKGRKTSVKCVGNIGDAFLWNGLGQGITDRNGWIIRLLDGPTGQVWIDPWVRHLQSLGVRFHTGQSLQSFDLIGTAIGAAYVADEAGNRSRVDADWYLTAMGPKQLTPILGGERFAAVDPKLGMLKDLDAGWENNLQFYFKRSPLRAHTAVYMPDHPWQMSGVNLGFQWRDSIDGRYGDGGVTQIMSLIVSDWFSSGPGMTVVNKPASQCSRQEVFAEVWGTIKKRFGDVEPAFRDENLMHWDTDPGLVWSADGRRVLRNDDPLSTNEVNTWHKRLDGSTKISNLFVGGDFLQNSLTSGFMDAAGECGRLAARALHRASDRRGKEVEVFEYYRPPQLEGIKADDAARFRKGLPNIFETDTGPINATRVVQEAAVRAGVSAAVLPR